MSFRSFAAAAAAVGLVAAASSACSQQLVPTQAAAKPFKLGAFELAPLRDNTFAIPNNGSVFGLNASPAAVGKVLAAAGAPTDKVILSVDGLLVRTPGHVVVIDTGTGPSAHGVLLGSLAAAGLKPDQVTDVFITHAHGDHVGGLVDAAGKSAFPKAAIHMSAKEWAFMQAQAQTKAVAAAVAAQVKPFEPGKPVLPGITPIALYGHTPGHVGYRIESGGRSLMDIGDTAHSSIVSLAEPGWTIQFDTDKAEGVAQRKAELARLAASHQLIFAPHFPYPGVGTVAAKGAGYVFQPGVPAK